MKNSFSDVSRTSGTALIIFGKNQPPANIRKWVFHEIKRDGITSSHGAKKKISQIQNCKKTHRQSVY